MKAWEISHKTAKKTNCRYGIIELPHTTTEEERAKFFQACGYVVKEVELDEPEPIGLDDRIAIDTILEEIHVIKKKPGRKPGGKSNK